MQFLEGIKNSIIDLTKEVHLIGKGIGHSKQKKIEHFSPYRTPQEFVKLNEELLKNKDTRIEFSNKIQAIYEYNKVQIGTEISVFFRLILRALFHKDLLKLFTWKTIKNMIKVTNTEVFKIIQINGSMVNKNASETDRYNILRSTMRKLKDTNRKRKKGNYYLT